MMYLKTACKTLKCFVDVGICCVWNLKKIRWSPGPSLVMSILSTAFVLL